MPLDAGMRLGPYQIIAPLGAGGMGEVYRAHDPRLGRDVAIKIVPETLAGSVPALERFEREARAVAALQHPNICAIYDIGGADGHRQFIVMELLEGETLQERLARGALDLSQLVDVGIAITDALDAAHGAGIIHRDIKPGNICLTVRGPKLLDFGLAKSVVPRPGAGASRLPTIPPEVLTDPGSTVGTVAYMSPEQVRGDALDARTDLFSFGAVLYEMATGRPPFAGATHGAISGAILYEQPQAPRQIRFDLPDTLDALILKTLEKDRDLRCQTASELRADLKRLKRQIGSDPAATASAIPSALSPAVPSTPARSSDAQVVAAIVRRHAGRLAVVAVAIVVALAAAAYVLWQERPPVATPPPTASLLDDLQLVQLTTSGNAERPAISPDGKYVAYIQHENNEFSLWIRQTATPSNVQIVPAQPGVVLSGVTVTPDANFVDYVRREPGQAAYHLWRVPFLGGPPRRLGDNVTSPIAWSPNGQHMAFVRVNIASTGTTTALVIADTDGSHQRELAVRRLPAFFSNLLNSVSTGAIPARLDWSPDGRTIALLGHISASTSAIRQVVLVDAMSGTERIIPLSQSAGALGLAWLDAQSIVLNHVVEDGQPAQLWRVAVPSGALSRLTNDLSRYVGVSLTADRSTLVTAQYSARANIWVGDAKGESGDESLAIERSSGIVAWAGERLLYMTEGRVMSVLAGARVPQEILTNAGFPAATSDGRTLVFLSLGAAAAPRSLWKADADGRNSAQIMSGDAGTPLIANNDRDVVFGSTRSGQQTVWRVPIEGGDPTEIVKEFATGISVSPDGHSLLYATQRDSGLSLVVCDLPSCTNRQTMARPDGTLFRWGPDGKSIAYRDAATRANLWIQPLDGTAARQLTHFSTDRAINNFAWSHDGRRLAVVRESVRNDIVLFKGLRPAR